MYRHRLPLLDALIRAGTPPVRRTVMHYGDAVETIPIKPRVGVYAVFAPRRTLLDSILVDAAIEAGVDAWFGVSVTELLVDETGRVIRIGGRSHAEGAFEIRAPIVIGADGVDSTVARQTGARIYQAGESSSAIIYGYWPRTVAENAYEFFYRPRASAGLIPTNAGQVCVWVGAETSLFLTDMRPDIESAFHRISAKAAPHVAERLRAIRRLSSLRAFPGRAGYLRQPWGPRLGPGR